MTWDVLAFGEALLRIQPQGDARLEDAATFVAHPGGAEMNTACALAGLGMSTAFFTVLPEGPLGRRVRRHLRAAGVDVSGVRTAPGRLGTYWVDYGQEPRTIEVHYDRAGSTVCGVSPADLPIEAVAEARLFYVTGITPALSAAARQATRELVGRARAAGRLVAIDLNYRSRLWSVAEAAPVLDELARAGDYVIAAEADLRLLFGWAGSEEAIAAQARDRFNCRAVVLTRGSAGALELGPDGVRRAAAVPCSRVDRIGAGDAFAAGYLWAALTGRAARALDLGMAMAALKHVVPGDALVTTPEEVERVAAGEGRDIRR